MYIFTASQSFLSLSLALTQHFIVFTKMKNTEIINKNINNSEVELKNWWSNVSFCDFC